MKKKTARKAICLSSYLQLAEVCSDTSPLAEKQEVIRSYSSEPQRATDDGAMFFLWTKAARGWKVQGLGVRLTPENLNNF